MPVAFCLLVVRPIAGLVTLLLGDRADPRLLREPGSRNGGAPVAPSTCAVMYPDSPNARNT